jgi:GTPase SAR1 family protein
MVEEREVTKERAIEFAKLHAIHKVFETSAKTGENVEEVFSCAGKELFMQTEKEEEVTPKEPVKNNTNIPKPKG